MADGKRTDEGDERKAERARLEEENHRLRIELQVRRDFEALYAANLPTAGDERDEALSIAKELLAEIDRCVHALKANDSAADAGERLRRMRRALHRVDHDEDIVTTRLIPLFHVLRGLQAYFTKKGRPMKVEFLREQLGEDVADWSDREVLGVVEARNFNVAMAEALTNHSYPMGPSNIERILKGRKSKKRQTH